MSALAFARLTGAQPPELVLDNITFGYAATPVIRDVTLAVAAGEMVALIGPNGGGKSTLLKIAAGVLKPRAGSVHLGGERLAQMRRQEVARRIAVVPQDFTVQFAYTVREVVGLGRLPHRAGLASPHTDDREAVARALERTGMAALGDCIFNELSGGERQRALMSLALAQSSKVVLLDEPTAHLDIKHQIEVLELLRRLNAERGLTVVAVLHDLNLAARYFPRLVLFNQRIIADGAPASVLDAGLLEDVYGTPVQVGILRGEEHLSVLPPGYVHALDVPTSDDGPVPPVVHVLAGGGSGELLMRALADARLAFSAGPLTIGDSDYALARRMAALCYGEPPCAPVSREGLAAARERMAAAQAVIVCPAPLSPGNISLLEAAREALRAGIDVILLEPGEPASGDLEPDLSAVHERDFSGRGTQAYREMLKAGARRAYSPIEATRMLEHEPA